MAKTSNRFLIRKLAFCVLLLLAACSADLPVQYGAAAPATIGDADEVAQQFLTAWTKGDYQTMYSLISPRSQIVAPVVFSDAYADVDQKLQLNADQGKAFELHSDQSVRRGTTAVVTYDMIFDSPALGKFRDDGRTMRLILAQSGNRSVWRIAWSTMDIFEGMAGGAQLLREIDLPTRGTIYDRNGNVIAQSGVSNYAVRVLTRRGNSEECYWTLNRVLRLSVPNAKKNYDPEVGQDNGYTIGTMSEDDKVKHEGEITAANCFVQYVPQITRWYYGSGIAAQTIGYVGPIPAEDASAYSGYPPGALVGLLGIEGYYEQQLAGEPGARLVIRTADGFLLRTIARKSPGVSQDVTLTIDRDLQLAVDKALASAYSFGNWGDGGTIAKSPGAAAVVMNISTGEVLAMASYPTFNQDAFHLQTTWDPDTITGYNRLFALTNRTTQTYSPASTFKIVSMAAAMGTTDASGKPLFTPNTQYNCDAIYKGADGLTRYDWIYNDPSKEDKFHGRITLKQGLTASCDDYFWHVGETLFDSGATNALNIFGNKLGLGIATGIEGVQEYAGNIPDASYFQRTLGRRITVSDLLNMVIGQGDVQVTPLQEARMMTAIANGGTLYTPYIVQQVGPIGGPPSYLHMPEESPTTIGLTTDETKAIESALCAVIRDDKLGTAGYVFEGFPLTQISICGKTGTAQNEQGAAPNAWFVAYAGPAGRPPEIAVVVFVERSREGSEVAAPIVRRIVESYYGLPIADWPNWWTGEYIPLANPGE
ncbi:MAG: penicillin-binding transpeptidase domain-containing protein [Anaerolineae bacterium]